MSSIRHVIHALTTKTLLLIESYMYEAQLHALQHQSVTTVEHCSSI